MVRFSVRLHPFSASEGNIFSYLRLGAKRLAGTISPKRRKNNALMFTGLIRFVKCKIQFKILHLTPHTHSHFPICPCMTHDSVTLAHFLREM